MLYIDLIEICCVTFPLLVPMLCCVFEEVCLSIEILCDIVSTNIVFDIVYDIIYDIICRWGGALHLWLPEEKYHGEPGLE